MSKVLVDFSNFEQADDGDTTHYGGTVTVATPEGQSVTLRMRGTDRDTSPVIELGGAVLGILGLPITAAWDVGMALFEHLTDEVVVELVDGQLTVAGDPVTITEE